MNNGKLKHRTVAETRQLNSDPRQSLSTVDHINSYLDVTTTLTVTQMLRVNQSQDDFVVIDYNPLSIVQHLHLILVLNVKMNDELTSVFL